MANILNKETPDNSPLTLALSQTGKELVVAIEEKIAECMNKGYELDELSMRYDPAEPLTQTLWDNKMGRPIAKFTVKIYIGEAQEKEKN